MPVSHSLARWLGARRGAIHLVSLVTLTLLAYANSFAVPFVFDDQRWIVDSQEIRALWPPATNRPVLHFTLALNYAIGGLDVIGYHVVNFLIHTAAGLTLYGIVRQTLARHRSYDMQRARQVAFLLSALWLVHPLQTQSVTYVIQRCESLMGLFYLFALYALLRVVRARPEARAEMTRWGVACVASCWLGMGTKEVMGTAPIVLLLFDRAVLATSWRELLRRRVLLHAGVISSWIWFIPSVLPTLGGDNATAGIGPRGFTVTEYLFTQPEVLLHYVGLSLWPSSLCFDYYWPLERDPLTIGVAGIIVVGSLLASCLALRRRPLVGFLALASFLILAPTSSVVPIAEPAAEHRMYLPLIGVLGLVFIAVRWVLSRVAKAAAPERAAWSRIGGLRIAAAAAVLCLSTAATARRNRDYASPEVLWTRVLQVSPHNPRPFNAIGRELTRNGRSTEAYPFFREAVRLADLSSHRPIAVYYYNLASVLHDRGVVHEAMHHYRRALRLQPRSTKVMLNLGVALAQSGRQDDAIEQYRAVLRVQPQHAAAHNNIALWHAAHERYDKAIVSFRSALRGEPKIPTIRSGLARALRSSGRHGEALAVLTELARIQIARGDWAAADRTVREALATRSVETSDALTPLRELQDHIRARGL